MDLYTDIGIGDIKKISKKYGIAMFVMLFNATLFQLLFGFALFFLISLLPDAKEIFDTSTDKGFAFIMTYNAVLSYTLPLVVYFFLFLGDLKYKPRPDEILPVEDYKRVFGSSLLLYLTGWTIASVGAYVTSFVSSLFAQLFGTPEVEAAFSDFMPQNVFMYAVFMFFVCIVSPVCEEIIYRYILLKPLRKYSDTVAAAVSAFLFALSHFNFDQFLYAFGLGYFLAIIAIRANSILPSVIVHIINNVIASIANYAPETFGNETIDAVFAVIRDIAPVISLVLLVVSLAAVVVTLLAHLLRLKNNCNIPVMTQFGAFCGVPVTVVAVVLSLAYTVLKLYM